MDSNDYNGVVWARLTPAEADQLVPNLVQQFRRRNLPALWQIDPVSQPADLGQRLQQLGCRQLRPGVCMVAALHTLPRTVPAVPDLTIERVVTRADLADWMAVWTQDDDEPPAPREQLYASLGLAGMQPLRHYLARFDDYPVGVAQLFLRRRPTGSRCMRAWGLNSFPARSWATRCGKRPDVRLNAARSALNTASIFRLHCT